MLIKCGSVIIQKVSQFCSSLDGESIDISTGHIARVAFIVHTLAQRNIEQNQQVSRFFSHAPNENENDSKPDNDVMVAKVVLTIEALDLLLACIDFLAVASPLSASQKSQEGNQENANPEDDETQIECTPQMAEMRLDEQDDGAGGSSAGHLRRCGDALQHCLEAPLLAPMLALALTSGGQGNTSISGCRPAVLRLLRVALNLPNFSSSR